MSDENTKKPYDPKEDTPETERTLEEGIVDGIVETIASPFRWARSFLGGIFLPHDGGPSNK